MNLSMALVWLVMTSRATTETTVVLVPARTCLEDAQKLADVVGDNIHVALYIEGIWWDAERR